MTPRKKRERYRQAAIQQGLSADASWEEIWNFLDNSRVTRRAEYVYFIGGKGSKYVKIGKSVNVEHRRRSLQTSYPEDLIIWGFGLNRSPFTEKELHARLAEDRVHGEWFKATDRVRQALYELQKGVT